MDKVMLTCFKNNTGALKMYRKLEYLIDDSSPASDIDDPDLQGCVPFLAMFHCCTGHVHRTVSSCSHMCTHLCTLIEVKEG